MDNNASYKEGFIKVSRGFWEPQSSGLLLGLAAKHPQWAEYSKRLHECSPAHKADVCSVPIQAL